MLYRIIIQNSLPPVWCIFRLNLASIFNLSTSHRLLESRHSNVSCCLTLVFYIGNCFSKREWYNACHSQALQYNLINKPKGFRLLATHAAKNKVTSGTYLTTTSFLQKLLILLIITFIAPTYIMCCHSLVAFKHPMKEKHVLFQPGIRKTALTVYLICKWHFSGLIPTQQYVSFIICLANCILFRLQPQHYHLPHKI